VYLPALQDICFCKLLF